MKILSQLATAPLALLWDEPKPLMLVTLGLTDLAFQGDPSKEEHVEFVADVPSLKRFSEDIAKMAATLEAKATKLGFKTEEEPVPTDGELVSEEEIAKAMANVIKFQQQDN